jgi:hypothetical protein
LLRSNGSASGTGTECQGKHQNARDFHCRENARAGDALPLWRRAFTVKPNLKAWAQKDRDLDPVRERAELAGMLA